MTTDIPFRFDDCQLLWQVERVLTARECAKLVADIERARPEPATTNPMFRDQERVLRDDPTLAELMFERMRPALPIRIGNLELVGLNERLRLYRYRIGQRFAPHMDHWYQRDERTLTLLTVLVYLNKDFEGGQTRFREQLDVTVQPQTGRAAVFQHKIRHEGCEVLSGTKYALRTDVLYRAPSPIRLTAGAILGTVQGQLARPELRHDVRLPVASGKFPPFDASFGLRFSHLLLGRVAKAAWHQALKLHDSQAFHCKLETFARLL